MKKFKHFLVAVMVMASAVSYAQVTTSSISGNVADGSGVLAGAVVKAVHNPSGTTYGTVTGGNGSYNLMNLRVGGPYTVSVSHLGYETKRGENIYLTLGEDLRFNVILSEDAEALSEVVVTGEQDPAFSTNRTGAQEIITGERMSKLPVVSRSLSDFTKLSPMYSNGGFGGVSYRFNNVTIDGASFNNSFGLASALGSGETEPISLETLDQVQVMIAPYDVRNGGFTGAGVNSVTKSGGNDFHATAYTYVKSPDLRGYRVKDEILGVSEFSNRQYGLSLSGAIVKNKLFYYLNGEIDRQDTPINYTTENSAADAAVLSDLSSFLQTNLGYNPGKFDVTKKNNQADRLTARVDWNVDRNNTLSVKYYHLKSFATKDPSTSSAPTNGRGPNAFAIPFSSSFYRENGNFDIFIADLNTKINDNTSNYFKAGYSRIRNFRDMDGGFFPQVDILQTVNGSLNAMTTFGTERNSYNNRVDQDVWQIQDNFVINLDRHQFTIGTQSDYRSFVNGYASDYTGSWVFGSVDDFKFNVLATKDYLAANGGSVEGFDITAYNPQDYGFASSVTGLANSSATGLTSYRKRYALGSEFPYVKLDVLQVGLYAQDKWSVSDRLNMTFGLRVDLPLFLTDLPTNDAVKAETYRDGVYYDVSKYPDALPVISPRFGFNYRPVEDVALQVRGGTGLFAGTPPYVWVSNQAGNNGVLFGERTISGDDRKQLGFTGDIDAYGLVNGTAPRSTINVTDTKFRYPTVWKNNIAADYKFGGWIATLELLYNKDVNAIYHDNIGIKNTGFYVKDGSGENVRPLYGGYYSQGAANDVILLRNASKGYSLLTTFQLQKSFDDGILNGLYLNGSYTLGHAKGLTDGTSSVAFSAWQYRQALDPNSQELGYSAFSVDGRLLLSASYTIDWSRRSASNVGLIYQRYRPYRYSYTYSGDVNGDGASSNDLIYIPATFDDVKDNLTSDNYASQAEAWAALDGFISQDPYLSKHRGEHAERNGALVPYANQLDLSLYHDIKVLQNNGRSHTLRFSLDIANFLNLLNKDWGVQYTTVLGSYSSNQYQFLEVVEKPAVANDYTLKYKMRGNMTETFKDNNASYWQAIFGVKYIF
ncbi:MAG: TonB-dependent receptor [Dysgonamonadaceae bacterium]|nr:TonB-dependent receptor [Dysgonamonadaceae bacterium]